MTAVDGGSTAELLVTNVLNGTVAAGGNIVDGGTVVRMELSVPDTGVPAVHLVIRRDCPDRHARSRPLMR